MNIRQFLLVLLARKWNVFGVFLITVTTTLIISLILPAQFTSTASIVVDVKSPDPIAGMVLPGLAMPGYMATQTDIINSDRVAQRVVRLLRLADNPVIREQWQNETEGRGTVEIWLADLLQKKLDVKPSRESNVINISYRAPDPRNAAVIANAFAQAYIETNIEMRVDPAKQYSTWFDQQSKNLRERLEDARSKLSDFQQQKGIVVSDERLNFENQKLNELQSQLVYAETQSAETQSQQRSGGGDTLRVVMDNPVVLQLKGNIALAEAKLKDLGGNLGENHPQYQRQMAEIASLKQQLADETKKISTSIVTSNKVSKEKEVELRAAIEHHKQRILELKKDRDEAAVLQQDVESAQRAYDAINQRFNQINLESQTTQTNIYLLTPATESLKPSSPRIVLNTAISAFLGLMLGMGIALMLEFMDQRVRSEDELLGLLETPVLGVIMTPKRRPTGWMGRFFFWRKADLGSA